MLELLAFWFLVSNMGWVSRCGSTSRPALCGVSAFILACLTASLIGIAMGMSRVMRGIFDPPLEFSRPLLSALPDTLIGG